MPRVIGIDPGTVSIDLCGLDNGRLFLDRSWPTAEALADPARFVAELEAAGPLDLVVGPSGYGSPITRVQDITEEALRLAFLAAPGETGGIGGLRNLVGALARTALPVVLTPGVVHLPTVPTHRKVNRVDMGTAEKVAAVAVAAGRIVDGVGGSAGPLGFRAAGALDGEVAYLAGEVPKALLFRGGAASIAGWDETTAPTRLLEGFAHTAKEGAQGAALIADGLAGGVNRELVERLAIREARGTVLDHLYVVPREQARRRLGLS